MSLESYSIYQIVDEITRRMDDNESGLQVMYAENDKLKDRLKSEQEQNNNMLMRLRKTLEIYSELILDFEHLLGSIVTSGKGNIGSVNNAYICQLDVRRIDAMYEKLKDAKEKA